VIIVSSISFIFYAASIVPTGLLTKQMRYKTIAIRSIVSAFLSGGTGVWMAYNGYGVWSIVIQQLLYVVFNTIGSYLAVNWFPEFFYRFETIRKMFRFGIFMFLSGVLDSVYTRLDVFIIGKVFPLKTLGQYSRAQTFDTQLRDLTSSSIIGVLFPVFALKRDKVEELRETYINYFEMVTLIFCLFSGALFLSADFVIRFLFGSQWTESIGYFKLLVIAGFAYPISSLSLSIIEARGNSKSFFRVEIIKKILFLPTYYIAFRFGITYFLVSYIIACFIGTFINVLFAQFEIEFDFWKIVIAFFKYYLPAAAIVFALYYLKQQVNLISDTIDGLLAAIVFVVSFSAIQFFKKTNGFLNLKAFITK
jgi:O-antigen/teichoic acid export membrane protein